MKHFIERCDTFCILREPRREPMISLDTPRARQKVGCDFFYFRGHNYLIVVDYHSRWIECIPMKSTSSQETALQLKVLFCKFGIPMEVVTDNGPQFRSKFFLDFAGDFGFRHITSSPHYPQSNGAAERAVKTVKHMLTNCQMSGDDPYLAMLHYRTASLSSGLSPAQLMFGRQLRSTLPVAASTLQLQPDRQAFLLREAKYGEKMKNNYDKRRAARDRAELVEGQRVSLPGDQLEGVVRGKHTTPRSYIVDTHLGDKQSPGYSPKSSTDTDDSPSAKIDQPLRRSEKSNLGVKPLRYRD